MASSWAAVLTLAGLAGVGIAIVIVVWVLMSRGSDSGRRGRMRASACRIRPIPIPSPPADPLHPPRGGASPMEEHAFLTPSDV